MDSLIRIFDKLNSKSKYQVIIIIAGLILPSQIYLTLNFPIKMYSLDLIKTILIGLCVNFAVIYFITACCILFIVIGMKKYLNDVLRCYDHFKERIEINKHRFKELRKEVKTTKKSNTFVNKEQKGSLYDEFNMLKSEISEMKSYNTILEEAVLFSISLPRIASDISIIYMCYIIFFSILNLFIKNETHFSTQYIFKDIMPIIISSPIVYSIGNYIIIKKKYKEIQPLLNKYIK